MEPSRVAIAAAMLSAAVAGFGPWVGARAQALPQQHAIPQSLLLEQQETMAQLTKLSQRPAPVGAAARLALVVYREHMKLEDEFILPPIALLQELAGGRITPDMKWAIAMADRVKDEREKIFEQDTEVTDAMNTLAVAAEDAHDADALAFARAGAADLLIDMELREPMTIVIGEYLRAKLPPGQ